MKFKKGDKVKFVDTRGLSDYKFSKHIKKNKIYTVKRQKQTGGILLDEFKVGTNWDGNEQGLMPHRFEKVPVMNKYKCPLCGKIIKCKDDRKWIKSMCSSTGNITTRIILQVKCKK